jgi:hypothetical protein
MVLFATAATQKTKCSHTLCLQHYSWPLRVTVMPNAYHSHSYNIRVTLTSHYQEGTMIVVICACSSHSQYVTVQSHYVPTAVIHKSLLKHIMNLLQSLTSPNDSHSLWLLKSQHHSDTLSAYCSPSWCITVTAGLWTYCSQHSTPWDHKPKHCN